ncbi:hypothetical protein AVEN_21866-1 [Araneus ventricosus]|uniref:Uncharacterized protein n=1 Tax=Araneus ventricosus TaxID=182803 RepID=A0A4Y2WEZ4_ARAVE|nr:hypothetical protein AVEN_21866-1 [Araneus ventricosus]
MVELRGKQDERKLACVILISAVNCIKICAQGKIPKYLFKSFHSAPKRHSHLAISWTCERKNKEDALAGLPIKSVETSNSVNSSPRVQTRMSKTRSSSHLDSNFSLLEACHNFVMTRVQACHKFVMTRVQACGKLSKASKSPWDELAASLHCKLIANYSKNRVRTQPGIELATYRLIT